MLLYLVRPDTFIVDYGSFFFLEGGAKIMGEGLATMLTSEENENRDYYRKCA